MGRTRVRLTTKWLWQVDILPSDEIQAHSRVSVLLDGGGGAMQVLQTFLFTDTRMRTLLVATPSVRFVLPVPLWRFSTGPPGLIVGACDEQNPDAIHIYTYNFGLQRVLHTTVVDCLDCCGTLPSKTFALLDMLQGHLHLVRDSWLRTVDLDGSDIEDPSRNLFEHDVYSRGMPVHARVLSSSSLRRDTSSMQILQLYAQFKRIYPDDAPMGMPDLYAFALWRDTENRENTQFGLLDVAAGESTRTVWIRMQEHTENIRAMIQKDHYRGSHLSTLAFEIYAESFAFMNDWDYTPNSLKQALPTVMHVVFSCGTNTGARIFTYAELEPGAPLAPVRVLRVIGVQVQMQDDIFIRFAHVLVPLRVHELHANIVVAKSTLVEVRASQGVMTISTLETHCASCSDSGKGRTFDASTQQCECQAGAVSVCVPCIDSYACNIRQYTFDFATMQESQTCLLKPTRDVGNLFYESCMLCQKNSPVFCPGASNASRLGGYEMCFTEEVDGVTEEEDVAIEGVATATQIRSRNVSGVHGARSSGDCRCAHGTKNSGADLVYNDSALNPLYRFMGCDSDRQQCQSNCEPCSSSEICNEVVGTTLSYPYGVIPCPLNTHSQTTRSVLNVYEDRIRQECGCNDGYQRIGEVLGHSPEPSILDTNVLLADWRTEDMLFFQTLSFHISVHRCSPCPENHFCLGGRASACQSNSVSTHTSPSCSCIPGWFAWSVEGGCQLCPKGSLCFANQAHSCELVQAGKPRDLSVGSGDVFCPCSTAGQTFDEVLGMCVSCPANHYCPFPDLNMQPVDPYKVNMPVRCPDGSDSVAGASTIVECVCAERFFMSVAEQQCLLCVAGSYCADNRLTPCPPGTFSLDGATTDNMCECTDTTRARSGDGCVCKAHYRESITDPLGPCEPCPFPYFSILLNSRTCSHCRDGFWKVGVVSAAYVTASLSSHTDNPLSKQHYAVTKQYWNMHKEVLRIPSMHSETCLICPPGFVCRDGAVTRLAPGIKYAITPLGAPSTLWMQPCPVAENSVLRRESQPLIMLGSCFTGTATWKRYLPSPLYCADVTCVLSRLGV